MQLLEKKMEASRIKSQKKALKEAKAKVDPHMMFKSSPEYALFDEKVNENQYLLNVYLSGYSNTRCPWC